MNNDKILKLLTEIGLNENEVKVYLTLLGYDGLPIKQILRLTKIGRGNLYNTLYLLEEKQLVEEYEKKKIKHFRALNLQNIKKFAEVKKKNIESTILDVDQILPELVKSFHISSTKPAMYYYEGLEGVQVLYDKILKEKKNLDIFTSFYEKQNLQFAKMLATQIKKQKKIGIKVRSISGHYYSRTKYLEILSNNGSSRTIDGMKMESEIYIFGDNIAITTFKQQDFVTTLIVNKNISQTLKTIFNTLWSLGKDPKSYIG